MRKELKSRAKQNIKKHYAILLIICLFASFFGIEYAQSTMSLHSPSDIKESFSAISAIVSGDVKGATLTIEAPEIKEGVDLVEVIKKVSQGKSDEVKKDILNYKKQIQKNSSSKFLGHQNGVFAQVVNAYSSGEFRLMMIQALISISGSENATIVVLIIFSLMGYLLIWLFIKETYKVITRRIVLEGRTYDKLTVQRFLYPIQSRSWVNIAWTTFVRNFYMFFWSLTIVGAAIKHYSYAMVPYILAENPKLKPNQVITLSRKMMDGHKFELFVADLSFIGWILLDVFTMGLSGIFFSNPYRVAFYTEYYARRREDAIADQLEGSNLLSDVYLYKKADGKLLADTYPEITQALAEGNMSPIVAPTGFLGFLVKWFGIEIFPNDQIDAYENSKAMQYQLKLGQAILDGKIYPGRLAPVQMSYKLKSGRTLRATRSYSLLNLIYIFFAMSIIGWMWEVSLHLIRDGVFVNRGIMQGPWLPIYGAGSVLILIFLKRFREKPILEFISAMVLCGCVEYFTSWYMEIQHHGQKWWDYTGYFLNLNGRICGEGLLVFGLGGIAIVYFFAPLLDNILLNFNSKVLLLVAILLVGSFTVDSVYSKKHPNVGEGITSEGTQQVAMKVIDGHNASKTYRRKKSDEITA